LLARGDNRGSVRRALANLAVVVGLLVGLGSPAPPAAGSDVAPPARVVAQATSTRTLTPTALPLATTTATAVQLAAPTLVPRPTPAAGQSSVPPLQVAGGVLPAPQVEAPGGSSAVAARPAPAPGGRPESDARGPRYAGWATEAYPGLSADVMGQIVARQRDAGANVVWIGHNNPGEVDAQGKEPGLSYAVFEALQNELDPRYADAQTIVAAQERMLAAIRAQGLKAVLPIGYQSQMGSAWDAMYPDAVRTESRGGVNWTTAVVNASFYSPDYRRDTRRYYEWVVERLVRPYRDVILMVNLADEPSGGDYSTWADAAFKTRYGYSFAEVGDDPTRIAQLGEFQSNFIADYAAWSAGQWAELLPDLPTTMSFEGATARVHFQLPWVESVFERTPPTFYPTFDAYPRDGPPDMAIDDAELIRLFTLVRSVGHYSARYGRPFWLWSTGNSWGLAQQSPQPANVADAVANAYYLAMLSRQMGGWLQGIAVWNYNVVGQGLYNDTNRTTYDPDVMFARVSESFSRLRQIMAGPPGAARVLLLAPNGFPYRQLGSSRTVDPFAFRSYELHRLAAFARNNVPAALVARLAGEDLSRVSAVVVLARYAPDVTPEEARRLRDYLDRGGTVIAPRYLRDALGPKAQYIDGDRPEEAFADSPLPERAVLWRQAFGVERPLGGGFAVATAQDAVLYNIGSVLRAEINLPFAGRGWLVDPSGYLVDRLTATGGRLSIALDRNSYAYLTQ
jgi:hypothetical protein